MLRLYFNKRSEKPWSVDRGEGTPEFQFSHVDIECRGSTVQASFMECAVPDDRPVVWIQFDGKLLVDGVTAIIVEGSEVSDDQMPLEM
jgi:hypothetical protein